MKYTKSSFREWWYFDTNCISELVKLSLGDYSTAVNDFIYGKDVLVSSSLIQELRKAPNLLHLFPKVFQNANLFIIPDLTKFWYTDFINYLNISEIRPNSLEIFKPQSDFFEMIIGSKKSEFEKVCNESENDVAKRFIGLLKSDIGANIDERDLCVIIWCKVSKLGKLWFNIDIPANDCNSMNFPSFYIFYYVYYLKFIKNCTSKPENNDFIDLANCLAAPYCQRYYCEAKYAAMLQREVKDRCPPSAFQLIKKLYKKGQISKEKFEESRKEKKFLSKTGPLLHKTNIFSFSEMRKQVIS